LESHLFFVILTLHSKRGTYVHYLVYNLDMRILQEPDINMWEAALYKRGDLNGNI
jgi:hypothetical protein